MEESAHQRIAQVTVVERVVFRNADLLNGGEGGGSSLTVSPVRYLSLPSRRFAHLLVKKDVSCPETKKDLLRKVKSAISSTAERFSGNMENVSLL